MGSASARALALDEAAIDADIRAAIAGIDVSAPGAAVRLWRAFLVHAARPLAFADRFKADKDNDAINFEIELDPPRAVYVTIARRIGVDPVADDGEVGDGTIVSGYDLTIGYNDAWASVRDRQTIVGYGVTNDGLAETQALIEESAAFAALAVSRVLKLTAGAHWG
jgi:hypothetical protein